MKTTPTINVKLPSVPNFLVFDDERCNGSIPIAAIPDDQLQEIGKRWTDALIIRARKQRTNPAS